MAESAFLNELGRRALVADGATASQLQARDLTLDDVDGLEGGTEVLNVTRPDTVRQVHRGFLGAGSGRFETRMSGADRADLSECDSECDIEDRIYELAEVGARLAGATCDEYFTPDKPRSVLGSVGPGTTLPTLSHAHSPTLRDACIEQDEHERRFEQATDAFVVHHPEAKYFNTSLTAYAERT